MPRLNPPPGVESTICFTLLQLLFQYFQFCCFLPPSFAFCFCCYDFRWLSRRSFSSSSDTRTRTLVFSAIDASFRRCSPLLLDLDPQFRSSLPLFASLFASPFASPLATLLASLLISLFATRCYSNSFLASTTSSYRHRLPRFAPFTALASLLASATLSSS